MQIFIGADHGGFELKEKIKELLQSSVENLVEDCGALTLDSEDDYPIYAKAVAQKVLLNPGAVGILMCRSGGGMTIAANRYKGIRAVECFDERSAEHARSHNDANIVTLSADWISAEAAFAVVQTFLNTPFSQDERHKRRLGMLDNS